jgi:predicted PurR-regulated permease PerM
MEKNINVLNYINLNDIIKEFKMYYKDILSSNILWKGAEFTTDIIFSYFVANISAYFILVDKDDFKNSIQYFINKNKLELINKNFEDIKKMLKVEITLVIATTLQTVFGFLILEIDNAVFLGMLCGILDILPYVGTVLVFLPLVIYKIYLLYLLNHLYQSFLQLLQIHRL